MSILYNVGLVASADFQTLEDCLDSIISGLLNETHDPDEVFNIVCTDCITRTQEQVDPDTWDENDPFDGIYKVPRRTYDLSNRPNTNTRWTFSISIFGATQGTPRTAIWFEWFFLCFRGLRFNESAGSDQHDEIGISFDNVMFYSRSNAPMIMCERCLFLRVRNTTTAGRGTIARLGDCRADISGLRVRWHQPWDYDQREFGNGYEARLGDQDSLCLRITQSRMGIIHCNKRTEIRFCENFNEGIDQFIEGKRHFHDPYQNDPDNLYRRDTFYRLGNMVDRVTITGDRLHWFHSPLVIRRGGFYNRMNITNKQPMSNIHGEHTPHTTGITIQGADGRKPYHIAKTLLHGWYRGIRLIQDLERRLDCWQRHHGLFCVKDCLFRRCDIGIHDDADFFFPSPTNRRLINQTEILNNRFVPATGETIYGVNAFLITHVSPFMGAGNPDNVGITMACSNGQATSTTGDCYSIDGFVDAGGGYTCDRQTVYVGTATDEDLDNDSNVIDLTPFQQEGQNHEGCNQWELFQWGGGGGSGTDFHSYQTGNVDSDGNLSGLPSDIDITIIYSGNLFLRFFGDSNPCIPAGGAVLPGPEFNYPTG